MFSSRALQYPVRMRFIALVAFTVIAMTLLSANALRASAESEVYSHPQTNVVIGCGIDSEPGEEPYRLACEGTEIYKPKGFVYTRSLNYGSLFFNEKETVVGVKLALAPHEQIVQIETVYIYANNHGQVPFRWKKGEGTLPVRRQYKGAEVFLEYVRVGLHSPLLPNQPPEPEHEGMR